MTRPKVAKIKENWWQNEQSVEAPVHRTGYPFCQLFYWVRREKYRDLAIPAEVTLCKK